MADQQPGDTPAAAEPTRVGPGEAEPSTVDAPVRWSGSAAVPPPSREADLVVAPHAGRWRDDDRTTGRPRRRWIRGPGRTRRGTRCPRCRRGHAADPDRPSADAADPAGTARVPAAARSAAADRAAAALRRRWRRKQKSGPTGAGKPGPGRATSRFRHIPCSARPLPPPNWRPPNLHSPNRRPLPPPPRRRRRWPRNLALFTLFSVVCCCGVPACFALAGRPAVPGAGRAAPVGRRPGPARRRRQPPGGRAPGRAARADARRLRRDLRRRQRQAGHHLRHHRAAAHPEGRRRGQVAAPDRRVRHPGRAVLRPRRAGRARALRRRPGGRHVGRGVRVGRPRQPRHGAADQAFA